MILKNTKNIANTSKTYLFWFFQNTSEKGSKLNNNIGLSSFYLIFSSLSSNIIKIFEEYWEDICFSCISKHLFFELIIVNKIMFYLFIFIAFFIYVIKLISVLNSIELMIRVLYCFFFVYLKILVSSRFSFIL